MENRKKIVIGKSELLHDLLFRIKVSNIFHEISWFYNKRQVLHLMTENIKNDFLINLERLHTTQLGVVRIKRNLELEDVDVVEWSKKKAAQPNSTVMRRGKNWYIAVDGCEITVNAHSYTIITAHKIKR